MSNTTATIEGGYARRLFVVANGSRGRAYAKRLGESGYDALLDWDAPDARRKDADQGEDRPGRAFGSAGAPRSAMERDGKDDGPKEHARRDLARRIAEDLAAVLRTGKADSLALIAPAPFATAIRSHLPGDLQPSLVREEHHDLTGLPTADLFARLDGLRHGS